MKASYSATAEAYAHDVIAGRTPASKYIRLACQRHLDDLAWQGDKEFKFRFAPKKGAKVCAFIERLPHTKGKWAAKGERLKLEPWQVFFIVCAFGWLRKKDGLRRFRKILLLVPRKNGKSALAAGIGLYMLCEDGEHGAEVYSGATSEKQAWEVFRPAKLMAQKLPPLQSHYGLSVNAKNLHILGNGSRFEPIIGTPGDGASPSCAIVDEYHEHQTDALYSTMETGMGAREQPIMLVITTAGDNVAGPCYAMQQEAQSMLEGTRSDDELFALIYGIDNTEQTVIVQSYHALRELDAECQKRDAQITLTEKSVREVCASVATRHGDGRTLRSAAGTIPSGRSEQATSAGHATSECSKSETRNTGKSKTATRGSGQSGTRRNAGKPETNGGSRQRTSASSATTAERLNTALSRSDLPQCLRPAVEDAKSVAESHSTYAWIIATIVDEFAGCSVAPATLQSACWEITKRVWNQHSNIFEEARLSIGEASLTRTIPPDDWTDPDVIRKANPNFGVSVFEDFLLARQVEAMSSQRKAGAFKTKHLNVWVQARDAYFNVLRFNAAGDPSLTLDEFEGQECIIGIDLAEKRDLTAVELLFRHGAGYARFGRYYLPAETIELPENEHFRTWRDQGLLIETDGAVTDDREIREDILEFCARFNVREVAFDPLHSRQMAVELMEQGVTCLDFPNRPTLMNEPMRKMDALIADGKLYHDGGAPFMWMLSNVVNRSRTGDIHSPAKERAANKIDGPVACMMALGRWLLDEPQESAVSPWDDPEFSLVG